jgi:glycerophosphoryl diester phosphodiesterase
VTIIAHRGASWDSPENTFAAFDRAVADGADWIEHDLQLTRDGVVVIVHDDSLDRTARGPAAACTGLVRERTLADLRRCEVGSWFNEAYPERARREFVGASIPTLDSVLTRYAGRSRSYLEMKAGGDALAMESALLAALRAHGRIGAGAPAGGGTVVVESFDEASLRRVHAIEPTLPLLQLLGDDPIPPAALAARLRAIAEYAWAVGPSRRITSARFVDAAHAAGLEVIPYTVNETAAMRYMVSIGVDGMFTDRPAELRRLTR